MALLAAQPPPGASMPAPISHTPLPHLKAWRLHRLMTVRGLAKAAGVSASTVGWAERGKPAAASTAIRLARALGVTVRQLKEEEPLD